LAFKVLRLFKRIADNHYWECRYLPELTCFDLS